MSAKFEPGMLVRIVAMQPDDDEFFSLGDQCRLVSSMHTTIDEPGIWEADFNGLGNPTVDSDGVWYVSEAQIEPVEVGTGNVAEFDKIDEDVTLITIKGQGLQDLKDSLKTAIMGGESVPDDHCISCRQPFTDTVNIFTEAGRREARISQMCEKCFDKLWKDA